jgi:hypothetical protein
LRQKVAPDVMMESSLIDINQREGVNKSKAACPPRSPLNILAQ